MITRIYEAKTINSDDEKVRYKLVYCILHTVLFSGYITIYSRYYLLLFAKIGQKNNNITM